MPDDTIVIEGKHSSHFTVVNQVIAQSAVPINHSIFSAAHGSAEDGAYIELAIYE